MSTEVKAQNSMALASVESIYKAAAQATALLASMEEAAQLSGTTLDGIYADAEVAKTSANSALANLTTIENVVGTLNWITAHGTMTLTTDTALDPTHVYFVQDNNGDYTVGGTRYAVVTEPNVADISTYYELSIDESLNNYVATHLAVDSEGLWIIPDAGGNKVLIATGQGSTYTSAGTYIIGKVSGVDKVLASFLTSGITVGEDDNAQLLLQNNAQLIVDKYNNRLFEAVVNIRGSSSNEDAFHGDGVKTDFYTTGIVAETRSVEINDILKVEGTDYERVGNRYTFASAPASGDRIVIKYWVLSANTNDWYYTLGVRNENAPKGEGSVAEGELTVASGDFSHAEGNRTTASGMYSHAEGKISTASGDFSHAEGYSKATGSNSHAEGGYYGNWFVYTIASGKSSHAEGYETQASGDLSHAQNKGTIAGYEAQTAIGKYNDNQSNNAFEIGNGTGAGFNRSNAFTVDWSGNVNASGEVTDGSGNALSDKADSGDVYTKTQTDTLLADKADTTDLDDYVLKATPYFELDTTAASGTDKEIYDALVALGWDSDVIV